MKKQVAVVWALVLLLSLGLIVFLIAGSNQHASSPTETLTPLPTTTPAALVLAPTRFLPTVAPVPTATARPVPTLYPTPTTFVPTLVVDSIRVFQPLDSASSQFMLASYCSDIGTPVSLRIFDWKTGGTVTLNNEAIAQLPLSWDASNSIWEGYQALRPFNQPDGVTQRWKISLFLPNDTERWINIYESVLTPETDYVYTFQNTVAFADKHGQHYGYHPCRAFTITTAQIQDFLSVVSQYQNIVHYPAFIPGDDPRWTLGVGSPVGAYADLRSIPSTLNNVPIAGISQRETLWYALDPTWGSWAQVKVGSVQGWVDTHLVTLTAG